MDHDLSLHGFDRWGHAAQPRCDERRRRNARCGTSPRTWTRCCSFSRPVPEAKPAVSQCPWCESRSKTDSRNGSATVRTPRPRRRPMTLRRAKLRDLDQLSGRSAREGQRGPRRRAKSGHSPLDEVDHTDVFNDCEGRRSDAFNRQQATGKARVLAPRWAVRTVM